ncbi:MAG: LysM peptidoglycan-binding domain-containing protein [Elusimicrobia bacterium]|nr:LysM peptidoglycan-binding domain-containing protein [Elusimicrobiota bacterium]MBP9127189.1 LysM peptidoglycan-binding domain-containing protein [Elusimicrobiota bacterium]MBP9698610.1 LysM peptidoglycan-binding domain-containing protein [Elusimicrobiota bacterium]
MKRVSVLALVLAFAPFVWAEEAVSPEEADLSVDAAAVEPADSSVPVADETVVDAPAAEPVVDAPVAVAEPVTAVAPVEKQEIPSESVAVSSHKVVRGDTLWALAGSYLQDPFLWPKIFEANRSLIQDPHWIYPSQEFVIPSMEAAATMASAEPAPVAEPVAAAPVVEAEPVPVEEPAAEAPTAVAAEDMDVEPAPEKKMVEATEDLVVEAPVEDELTKDANEAKKKRTLAVPGAGFMGGVADSFIADENWEYDGYVLRDRDQRMMISQGDVVYLNIGAASGVKPKMVANLYRVGKKVRDPYLKTKSGRMVKRVGAVMVTGAVTEEGCTAVVTNSLEPIRIGDIVKFSAR